MPRPRCVLFQGLASSCSRSVAFSLKVGADFRREERVDLSAAADRLDEMLTEAIDQPFELSHDLMLRAKFAWSFANLLAMLRLQLFVYRDLQGWLDQPFRAPPTPQGLSYEQLSLPLVRA